MNLHANCLDRLKQITVEALTRAKVENGQFLSSDVFELFQSGDSALPKDVVQRLSTCVSDHPFTTFAFGLTQDRLRDQLPYEAGSTKLLTAVPGFEDPVLAAKAIVDGFVSLPWQYDFIFELPFRTWASDAAVNIDHHCALGEQVALVRPGAAFRAQFPIPPIGETLEELLFSFQRHEPRTWSSDHLYFLSSSEGFVTDSFDTQLVKDVRLLIRSTGGLFKSCGLTSESKDYTSAPSDAPIQVYRHAAGTRIAMDSHRLDAEYTAQLRSMRWFEKIPATEHQLEPLLTFVKSKLSAAYGPSDAATILRRCSQWYFDSLCGSNHLLQFIQATVAVEILLGDKAVSDVVGLVELLANRCAYSLAESHAERAELLKSFRDIYSTRSQIVHRGKAQLSDVESTQLARLQFMCGRLVDKELDLLAEKKSR